MDRTLKGVIGQIIVYGTICIGGLYVFGCAPKPADTNSATKPAYSDNAPAPVYEPFFLSGEIKNENFERNITVSDVYTFSLKTKQGLKIFWTQGDDRATTLDMLVDPRDKVKIKLDARNKSIDGSFYITKYNLEEINGQPFEK